MFVVQDSNALVDSNLSFKTNLLCLGGFLIFGAAPLGQSPWFGDVEQWWTMTTQDNLRVHASKIVFCRVALIFQVRKSWFHADHVTPQVYRSEPVLKGLKKIWRTSKQSSRPGNRQLRAPGVEDPWFLRPFLVPLPELQMVDLPANNIGMLEGNWLVWGDSSTPRWEFGVCWKSSPNQPTQVKKWQEMYIGVISVLCGSMVFLAYGMQVSPSNRFPRVKKMGHESENQTGCLGSCPKSWEGGRGALFWRKQWKSDGENLTTIWFHELRKSSVSGETCRWNMRWRERRRSAGIHWCIQKLGSGYNTNWSAVLYTDIVCLSRCASSLMMDDIKWLL